VVGHNVARAILETSHSRSCDLIVLGWKGYTSTARRILGEITDTVVTHAKADILVMKRVGSAPIRRFLLPTAGGEHAQRAEAYTASLARMLGGAITVCKVIAADAGDDIEAQARTTLDEASERLAKVEDLSQRLLRSDQVVDAILSEAQAHDAIVIGAAGPASYRQLLMGTVPEDVARDADRTVIIVKRHNRVKAMIGRVLAA
jgi:APA family basic amino acid/polyamine antiporter